MKKNYLIVLGIVLTTLTTPLHAADGEEKKKPESEEPLKLQSPLALEKHVAPSDEQPSEPMHPNQLIKAIYDYRQYPNYDKFFESNREGPNPFLDNVRSQSWEKVTAYTFPMIRIYIDELQKYFITYAPNPTGILPSLADDARAYFQNIRMLSYILRTALAYGHKFAQAQAKIQDDIKAKNLSVAQSFQTKERETNAAIERLWRSKKKQVQDETNGILRLCSIDIGAIERHNRGSKLYCEPNDTWTSPWKSETLVGEIVSEIDRLQTIELNKTKQKINQRDKETCLQTLQVEHPRLLQEYLVERNRLLNEQENYKTAQNKDLTDFRNLKQKDTDDLQTAFSTAFAEFSLWGAVSLTGVIRDFRVRGFLALPSPQKPSIDQADKIYQIGFWQYLKSLPASRHDENDGIPLSSAPRQERDMSWLGEYFDSLQILPEHLPHDDFLNILGIKAPTQEIVESVSQAKEEEGKHSRQFSFSAAPVSVTTRSRNNSGTSQEGSPLLKPLSEPLTSREVGSLKEVNLASD